METPAPVVRPAVMRLPIDIDVDAARTRLLRHGAAIALVTDHDHDVGVVTLDDVEGRDPSLGLVEVVNKELVSIPPRTNDLGTLDTYRHAAWDSLRRRRPGSQH